MGETATSVSVESHLEEAYWRFVNTEKAYLAGETISGLQLTRFFRVAFLAKFLRLPASALTAFSTEIPAF